MRVLMQGLPGRSRCGTGGRFAVVHSRTPPVAAIGEAIQQVHFPPPQTDLAALDRGVTAAHRRLAFEELFRFRRPWC